ncbi:Dihydrolipoyllysine-residue succinyltransferase component of 2-oxoglutarate dehydrogenase complex [Yarrowia sp. B02]|nr:Dihydrolipoyllysine-residue succinyltransferase component of 2-oxoglutarate dehydrogenase complex [Yarrowia sp. B02]
MLRTIRSQSMRMASASSRRMLSSAASTSMLRQTLKGPSMTAQVSRPTVMAFKPVLLSRGYADVVEVPPMAESLTEGTLTAFEKDIGDFVEADEEIATIETDKIDVAVNAPFAGTITEFLVSPDDTVTVGQPLLKIERGEGSSSGSKPPKEEKKEEPKEESKEAAPKEEAAPKKEEAPKESAPAPKKEEKPAAKKDDGKKTESVEGLGGPRKEERVKMNRMRLRIAERLKESQNTAASLTTFNEVDMSSLMEMRKLYKDELLKKTGTKLGFMGAFSKAAALAMRDVPAVNAAIEGPNGGDTIVYRDYVDISVAVATPKGLVTPVVRNCDQLDVMGIEKAIHDLGVKARDNKITLEDMAGGTFTISNGGVFGSLFGTPIINMPQTAVLGLHGVKDRAVVVDGQVVSRPMMYLALTYDHRVLDGREAVVFLRTIKELIEDPRKMLLM